MFLIFQTLWPLAQNQDCNILPKCQWSIKANIHCFNNSVWKMNLYFILFNKIKSLKDIFRIKFIGQVSVPDKVFIIKPSSVPHNIFTDQNWKQVKGIKSECFKRNFWIDHTNFLPAFHRKYNFCSPGIVLKALLQKTLYFIRKKTCCAPGSSKHFQSISAVFWHKYLTVCWTNLWGWGMFFMLRWDTETTTNTDSTSSWWVWG